MIKNSIYSQPLLVSSGEPAGIGPDLCLALAGHPRPLVIMADPVLLKMRAAQLGISINIIIYQEDQPVVPAPQNLTVWPVYLQSPVLAGELSVNNARYVQEMLAESARLCAAGVFSGLVTAPVQKSVLNAAGIPFTGHTEFFAEYFNVEQVVMLLACPAMKVALITTHVPLRAVADLITQDLVCSVITTLQQSLKRDFGLPNPVIYLSGLNPHAGEDGHLGTEEQEIILPAIDKLKNQGMLINGPFPADTLFTLAIKPDVFVAMYHDQGLAVLKYAGFGESVNITLGLPIIRTSVDHGTALSLAGTGKASNSSLLQAIEWAALMVSRRSAMERVRCV